MDALFKGGGGHSKMFGMFGMCPLPLSSLEKKKRKRLKAEGKKLRWKSLYDTQPQ